MGTLREGDLICSVFVPGGVAEYRIKNGIIKKETIDSAYRTHNNWDNLIALCKSVGYDSQYAWAGHRVVEKAIEPSVGKPIEDAEKITKRLAFELQRARIRNKKELERAENSKKRLANASLPDGLVLGLAKEIDVCESGFSVRVLLSSSLTFEQHKKLVKDNKAKICKWAMTEITERKSMLKAVGSMTFYKPVEMTILRSCEIEIKFEDKDTTAFENRIIASPA